MHAGQESFRRRGMALTGGDGHLGRARGVKTEQEGGGRRVGVG